MKMDAKSFAHQIARQWSSMTDKRLTGGELDDLAHELQTVLLSAQRRRLTREDIQRRAEENAFWYDT